MRERKTSTRQRTLTLGALVALSVFAASCAVTTEALRDLTPEEKQQKSEAQQIRASHRMKSEYDELLRSLSWSGWRKCEGLVLRVGTHGTIKIGEWFPCYVQVKIDPAIVNAHAHAGRVALVSDPWLHEGIDVMLTRGEQMWTCAKLFTRGPGPEDETEVKQRHEHALAQQRFTFDYGVPSAFLKEQNPTPGMCNLVVHIPRRTLERMIVADGDVTAFVHTLPDPACSLHVRVHVMPVAQ